MKRIKIAQTLSAALTLHTSAGVASGVDVKIPSEAAQSVAPFQSAGETTGTPDTIETEVAISLSHPNTEFSLHIDSPNDWQEKNTIERYKKLAVKEATSKLTKTERAELNHLEEIRDREESAMTGEQIIEQYKREKTGLEMLRILQTYVRVDPQK